MMTNFDIDNDYDKVVSIKVVGVGGGGGNAVNRMIEAGLAGVEFISINTDAQALKSAKSATKIVVGDKLTKGRGAGGSPEKGQRAAEESRDEIAAAIKGSQMVFIAAGMGGGTGTGAAPIVAQVAKEQAILTVGIVTKPFQFEGRKRMEQAEMGIAALREQVDALVVIPNERLKMISDQNLTLLNAFIEADNILKHGVQSISDLIYIEGLINLDFADICEIMRGAGYAHMGVGKGSGKDKAELAAKMAISSPLLESSIDGAERVILNITASPDISLDDIDKAADMIRDCAHPDVNLIFGVAFNQSLQDEMSITVIATGFAEKNEFEVADYKFKQEQEKPVQKSTYQPSPRTEMPPAKEKGGYVPVDEDDDREYFDIMSIFGKK